MKKLILLLVPAVALAACVDIRAQQRERCAQDGGTYIVMDEFDDDVCLLPGGEAYGFDD